MNRNRGIILAFLFFCFFLGCESPEGDNLPQKQFIYDFVIDSTHTYLWTINVDTSWYKGISIGWGVVLTSAFQRNNDELVYIIPDGLDTRSIELQKPELIDRVCKCSACSSTDVAFLQIDQKRLHGVLAYCNKSDSSYYIFKGRDIDTNVPLRISYGGKYINLNKFKQYLNNQSFSIK